MRSILNLKMVSNQESALKYMLHRVKIYEQLNRRLIDRLLGVFCFSEVLYEEKSQIPSTHKEDVKQGLLAKQKIMETYFLPIQSSSGEI